MRKPYSSQEKQNIFQEILNELKASNTKNITNNQLKERFAKKGCFIKDIQFAKLKIRDQLQAHGIYSKSVSAEVKKEIFDQLVEELLQDSIKILSNVDLISMFKNKFDITLRESEIISLGFRKILDEHGISNKYNINNKIPIIDKVIIYVSQNGIEIKNVTQLHKIALKFGNISRSTLDNHLDYIQKSIKIKNIKTTKRLKSLEMSDKEIIIETAKHYIKKGVYKITASEFRKYTNSNLRTLNIEVIRKNKNFLNDTYNIEIITIVDCKQENQSYYLDDILDFLKTKESRYEIHEVNVINDNSINNLEHNNVFIIKKDFRSHFQLFWDKYLNMYVELMSEKRKNVKNGLLNQNKLKIDTEKKQIVCLKHPDLNIEKITFLQFIRLTTRISKASNKAYGLHLQNMYIGFLLFLHSKNEIVIPFSYLYDVCYSGKKVQSELPFFLADHHINKKLLQYIKEKRLSIKDDKYKRIFQFFLLSLPKNYPIKSINFTTLSPLLDRNKGNFKQVVEIFNTLGAKILIEKPKEKYTDRYNKYKKINKYAKLFELFNKTMNRTYKLGSYSKEENIYKDWSAQYAFFFDFIEDNYSNENISESFLYNILNYPDEENFLTYQEYIAEKKLSSGTKNKRFLPLITAFSQSALYPSLKNLKDKTPVFESTNEESSKNQYRAPIINSIILEKLEDILLNRPPESNYHNKEITVLEKHKKWWKHFGKVAPFEPLILLAHLYIPARGINFRLADCDSFLVKDENNKTTGYHFTHDKNKKRKTPYVAPNIWGDSLEIIEELTKYVKFHFPDLDPIIYDTQNPKGILPLFPNKEGTNFYSDGRHMKYWKRVLLKAQIELNNENNEENILLIFPTSDLEIPQDPESVDTLSEGEMEKFQVKYDLHSLRHTGATKYANAGMPLGLLALLTGHIDMNVLQSVYIELNAQKMIAMWKNIQDIDIDIGGSTLAEAGKKFIHHIETIAKETLQENSPEKLLKFLEEGNFISIGSYLNKDELTLYELEDFAKIDPVFWSFRRYGICTSAQCPQGLENRCSLCPHFMTSPVYIQEVTAHINLQNLRLSKYGNMIIENRKKGNPQDNENIRKSAQIEMEEMLGWIKILQALDEVRLMVDESVDIANSYNKDLTIQDMKEMSIFSLAPIVNSDHSLLKLVYDSIELKEFEHESFYDASEKLVSKIIRYAARNNRFEEIDGIEKYKIFEWFKPVYQEVLSLERDDRQKNKLENILNSLSDKPLTNLISSKEVILLESKEEK